MEIERRNDRATDQRNHLSIQPSCDPRGGRVLLDSSNPPQCEVPNHGGIHPFCEDLAYDYYLTIARLWDDPQRDFDLNLKK